jgi:hypothetical protein
MAEDSESLLALPPEEIPPALREWIMTLGAGALLVSLELLPDGTLVLQALPGVDPGLVARVRRTFAQHEDVLRRLS